MGPGAIANFETLGYVDFRGSDYFRHGTHMHLSHIHEDVEAWYLNFDFDERVVDGVQAEPRRAGRARRRCGRGRSDVSTEADVHRDYRRSGRIGHSAAIQTTSRLQGNHVAADGTVYAKGAAIPVRADFNTLDNPFAWSERPDEIGVLPAAGVHFVVFNPTGDDFRRNRLAMDGSCRAARSPFKPRDRNQGFNSVLSTTHRQNFIVPPRAAPQLPARRGLSSSRRTRGRRRTTRRARSSARPSPPAARRR